MKSDDGFSGFCFFMVLLGAALMGICAYHFGGGFLLTGSIGVSIFFMFLSVDLQVALKP